MFAFLAIIDNSIIIYHFAKVISNDFGHIYHVPFLNPYGYLHCLRVAIIISPY